MFFVGGTALRFFYNLPRFSEDLDRGVLYANNIREEPKKLILRYLSEIPEKEFRKLAEQDIADPQSFENWCE